ncbi:cyd operon protein YbgT [Faunimonas pinastri]|uniref:Cyd operon protein YbgT n=1 Tax=Faunimonas pinastri TaxID=1855383 RepID=A0A1H9A6C0_9HYPH|nr:cytochrome bd-I oxidase subunit CydX [Faunimonas pinastri]SEP72209.1 cyd operon protein YbgT [Faunimonas pinastri]
MWYFSWILGVGLASSFAVLNALWFELRDDRRMQDATRDLREDSVL